MLMKAATKLVLISLVLSSALIASSEASKNETSTRFVFTYEFPGSSFFDDFPQLESVEEYIDDLADKWNATWTRIKNYTIAGLNFQVGEMAPFFAELIGELPFVKSLDQDVRMQVSRPLDSNVVQLSSEQTPYGINLVGALEVSDDPVSNRVVCIIDSGYDINHPDLPSTATGSDFGAGPWDQDGQQHGTHVAGTILALGGNSQGVLGVNRNGKIGVHIVRLFDDDGYAWASDFVELVNDCVSNNANVVSMSLGRTEGGPLEFERAAFQNFYEEDGLLLVAAAGNHGTSQDSWPASYEAVISVAAIDENKNVAYFSAFNPQVELAAPGVEVLSTIPDGQYAYFDGTSMACPHVSGVAALVWSHFPDKSNAEIRYALQQTAEDLGVSGRDTDYGFGLVRADLAYTFLSEGNSGTPEPGPEPAPTPAPIDGGGGGGGCIDFPEDWTDSGGDGCEFYDSSFTCNTFGNFYADSEYGLVAKDVCCKCGGGTSSGCEDEPGWTDLDGDGCSWYAEDPLYRCSVFGSCCENNGFTASEACCVCDGITTTTIQASYKNKSTRSKSTGGTSNPPGGSPSSSSRYSRTVSSFSWALWISTVVGAVWMLL